MIPAVADPVACRDLTIEWRDLRERIKAGPSLTLDDVRVQLRLALRDADRNMEAQQRRLVMGALAGLGQLEGRA